MADKRRCCFTLEVAELKYKSKPKNELNGKLFFFSSFFLFVLVVAVWLLISPSEFNKCDSGKNFHECGCPLDKDLISKRNIVLLDITDPIAPGKFPDIRNLIESFAAEPEPFFKWLMNGKKVEMTSLYLLSEKIPADMLPVGKFCKPPPQIALIASSSNQKIKKMQLAISGELDEALLPLQQISRAKASPIVETLAVATSNTTSWNPGGNLILVSDMLQNSEACGWFEKSDPIPKYSMTPSSCGFYLSKLKANLQKTSLFKGNSNVAICILPPIDGKKPKAGLLAYWHELFQDVLNYDFIESCNPGEINLRMTSLRN